MLMTNSWKERLLLAVDRDERSERQISKAAGLGPNYINQLRNSEKIPSMENVLKLASALNVSVAYIFEGREDISAEDELFLDILRHMTPPERQAALTLLRKRPPEEG